MTFTPYWRRYTQLLETVNVRASSTHGYTSVLEMYLPINRLSNVIFVLPAYHDTAMLMPAMSCYY